MQVRPVKIVCATRKNQNLFWRATLLGRSLRRIPDEFRPELSLYADNHGDSIRGLSSIYNEELDAASEDSILILVHDDVFIHDWFVANRANDAMGVFDVAGLAGSVNPDFQYPSWGLSFDENLNAKGWQENLQRSGVVNHYDYVNPAQSVYGPTPLACELLDGLFLIVNVEKVRTQNIRFDDQFQFHLYDLDFCRSCRTAGLQLGTWPISVTHDSGGAFHTPSFQDAAKKYLSKWQ